MTYTIPINPDLASVVKGCLEHATLYTLLFPGGPRQIVDIRMFYQKWPNNLCGFSNDSLEEGTPTIDGPVLAPTIVVKFEKSLRLVYHNGRFAYALVGRTTLQYYDAINLRCLPGVTSLRGSFMTEGDF